MSNWVDHISGQTFHGRKGAIENAFKYAVDYVLIDAERPQDAPSFFGRNRRNLFSLFDRDHGGAPGHGEGATWVRSVLYEVGFTHIGKIELLAQPRVQMLEVDAIQVLILVVAGVDEKFFAAVGIHMPAKTLRADTLHHALHG